MMTVMIRHKVTRREFLIACEAVEFEDSGKGDHPGLLLIVPGADSRHYALSEMEADYRDVFVMNAAGQTVARYTL